MIVRRKRTRNYTNIDNAVFDDERLVGHSLGVLTYLLSRPNNWEVQPDHLQDRFGVGRDRLQKIMKLLRECGYARIEYEHDPKTGKFRNCGYVITDEPIRPAPDGPEGESIIASAEMAETIENADLEPANNDVHRVPEKPLDGAHRVPDLPSDGFSGTKEETTTERKQTPPNPQGGLGEDLSNDPFEKLRQEWPSDPTINWLVVERRFLELSPADQADAARIAPRYIAYCTKISRKLKYPGNWLRERGWEGFLAEEKQTAAAVATYSTKVWVQEDSPRWLAMKMQRNGRMPAPSYCKGQTGLGWWFDAEQESSR